MKKDMQLLANTGVEMDDGELARFAECIDKDKNRITSFEERRDFLLLYRHKSAVENVCQHWETLRPAAAAAAAAADVGEQGLIPQGISEHMHKSKYFIAGGIAGVASRTATAPLDRLKVIFQVQTTRASLLPTMKKIWTEDGFLGFFRGNGLNVLKVAPESAIKFYCYEVIKKVTRDVKEEKKDDDDDDVGAAGRLFAGGVAGAVAQAAIYPLDLVKTRLQTQVCHGGRPVPRLGKLMMDIWVQEGPRAFYRGLLPSLIGIIPYAGIDLAAYETFKDLSKTYILHDAEPGPFVQLGCGTVSSAIGATSVYPLQVIRTRMQAQNSNCAAAYKGMRDVFWRTLEHEGHKGFYKGLFPNLLKVVPAASITYLVYEAMKKGFNLD